MREDLGALDKARGLKALKDATGWSIREMAQQVGMSDGYAVQLLKLLEEPEEIQHLITSIPGNACPASTSGVWVQWTQPESDHCKARRADPGPDH